jgi:peptidyl-prolyl cis-trans isomerase-like 3
VEWSELDWVEGLSARCRVIDGADSTLDAMERVPVNEKYRPLNEIKLNDVRLFSPSLPPLTQLIQITVHANPIATAEIN